MPYVFVFGTLKHGFSLHEEGLSGVSFLAVAVRAALSDADRRAAVRAHDFCMRVWAFRSLESCIHFYDYSRLAGQVGECWDAGKFSKGNFGRFAARRK